mmetsp:Transcript_4268/g.10675  ORF Transcript_4268/g.10675 Transcript_4268/m.10675 type:complete len:1147 (+) Transcript_4268:137-3577(+)
MSGTDFNSSLRSSTSFLSAGSTSSHGEYKDDEDHRVAEDRGPAWNLHDKLCGRDEESEIIQQLADERSTNVLLLHGPAGSGKTTLIERQPWKEQQWVFASGKYEQHRQNVPYSALIDALNDLCGHWEIHNAGAKVCQMGSFHTLLKEDIQFLRNILPKAFEMAGCCDRRDKMNQMKKQRQSLYGGIGGSGGGGGDGSPVDATGQGGEYVNASFWRILSFLCESRPVCLFLDDLQYADKASLDAIKVLATGGKVEGLLLVLAYRDEEVKDGDQVLRILQTIRKEKDDVVDMREIHVRDLDVANVNKLVASVLVRDPKETIPLAEVIFWKTLGNSFFVVQFLLMLRREQFIQYNMQNYRFEWGDVNKIGQLASVSDNVADIIAATIEKLPLCTRLTLKSASALGKVIPVQIMEEFFQEFEKKMKEKKSMGDDEKKALCTAVAAVRSRGIKTVLDDAVRSGVLNRSDDHEIYTWAHDKLQHVAYSMIDDRYRPPIHTALGQLLWQKSKENPDDEWMLYMAAEQLNRSAALKDDSLGDDVALLSLEAGMLSLSKSALFPALEMLRSAKKHVDGCGDSWEERYPLTLEIYSTLAEVSVRVGSSEEAFDIASEVIHHAKTLDDKYRAQTVSVQCKISGSNRDYAQGLEMIVEILRDYGIRSPTKLLPGQQFLETRKLKSSLGGTLEPLLTLPRVDESTEEGRQTRQKVTLLTKVGMLSYMTHSRKELGVYASTRALNVSIKNGVCPETALALCGCAMFSRTEGHFNMSLEFGGFAIKLVETFPRELGSPHAMVLAGVTAGVYSSCLPYNKVLDPFLEVNRVGLQTGDTEKASMGVIGYSFTYLNVGLPLGPLGSDMISFEKEARQFKMPETVQVLFRIIRQAILNLQARQKNICLLKGEAFDQEKELERFSGQGLTMTERDTNTFRLMLACIYQDWDVAESLVDSLEKAFEKDTFVARAHLRTTYLGIGAIVLSKKLSTRRRHHFDKLGKKIIKMFKDDVKAGGQNSHPVLLVLQAIQQPSKDTFNEAIRTCARLGLIHYEALVFEHAALYYLEQNDEDWAEYYMAQAYGLYRDWGATGKTDQLMENYSTLLHSSSLSAKSGGTSLKGRSRYIPQYSQRVKELNLARLSINSNSTSSMSMGQSSSSFLESDD